MTIVNFAFQPGSTTIHAGETVTWTNTGSAPHTATARDGSFSTGTLTKGQSGSHTFTQPGTYSYFCSVHPFMHGTIVVLAAAPSPPSSSNPSAPASSSQSTPSAGASSQPTLPVTGFDLTPILGVGLVLLAVGCLMRWSRPGRAPRHTGKLIARRQRRPSGW